MEKLSTARQERLLVCVGPGASEANVIRAARKMAVDLNAEWLAVHVKTPMVVRLSKAAQNQAIENLQLAEQLGAQTFILFSRNLGEKIGDFARRHNITRIIAGKPSHQRWRDVFFGSTVDELVKMSGKIDVYFITIASESEKAKIAPQFLWDTGKIQATGYAMGLLYAAVATGLDFLIYPYLDLSNLIMVYLLGVMVTSYHWGRGPAIFNAFLSVLAFYFFFVPVRYSFTLVETHFIFTFTMMLLVALVISHLTILIKGQAEASRLQERRLTAMHSLSRELATARGIENILRVSVRQLGEIFECQAAALLPGEDGRLTTVVSDLPEVSEKDRTKELNAAKWVLRSGQMAGWGTSAAPESPFLYLPLQATKAVIGVLALRLKDPATELWLLPEQLRLNLLESLAKQIALALEVERLEKAGLAADRARENESTNLG